MTLLKCCPHLPPKLRNPNAGQTSSYSSRDGLQFLFEAFGWTAVPLTNQSEGKNPLGFKASGWWSGKSLLSLRSSRLRQTLL